MAAQGHGEGPEEAEAHDPLGPEGRKVFVEDRGERWDCESVLSLRSNLDNHPRKIVESAVRKPEGGGGGRVPACLRTWAYGVVRCRQARRARRAAGAAPMLKWVGFWWVTMSACDAGLVCLPHPHGACKGSVLCPPPPIAPAGAARASSAQPLRAHQGGACAPPPDARPVSGLTHRRLALLTARAGQASAAGREPARPGHHAVGQDGPACGCVPAPSSWASAPSCGPRRVQHPRGRGQCGGAGTPGRQRPGSQLQQQWRQWQW